MSTTGADSLPILQAPTSHPLGGFSVTPEPSQFRVPHRCSPTDRERSEPSRPPSSSRSPFPSEDPLVNRYRRASGDDESVAQIPSIGTGLDDGTSTVGLGSDLDAEIEALEEEVEVADRQDTAQQQYPSYRRWQPCEIKFLVSQVDEHGPAWQTIWENNRCRQSPPIHLDRTPVNYKDKAMGYKVQLLKYASLHILPTMLPRLRGSCSDQVCSLAQEKEVPPWCMETGLHPAAESS